MFLKKNSAAFLKKFPFLFVAAFLFATVLLLQHFYSSKPVEISAIKHDNVILYATSWCGYCKRVRTFLDENNIAYIEYDVEESEEAYKQLEALGAKGVPVLDIKGTVILGYDMKNTKYVLSALHLF